eukprot:695639-Lingulodinium_polyedra.AAC.1
MPILKPSRRPARRASQKTAGRAFVRAYAINPSRHSSGPRSTPLERRLPAPRRGRASAARLTIFGSAGRV